MKSSFAPHTVVNLNAIIGHAHYCTMRLAVEENNGLMNYVYTFDANYQRPLVFRCKPNKSTSAFENLREARKYEIYLIFVGDATLPSGIQCRFQIYAIILACISD